MTRFGIYESVKNNVLMDEHGQMPFYQKVLLGGFAGTCGGFIGTPADMINVRYSTGQPCVSVVFSAVLLISMKPAI